MAGDWECADRFNTILPVIFLCDDMGLYVSKAARDKSNLNSILVGNFFGFLPRFPTPAFSLSTFLGRCKSLSEGGQFYILCVTRRL